MKIFSVVLTLFLFAAEFLQTNAADLSERENLTQRYSLSGTHPKNYSSIRPLHGNNNIYELQQLLSDDESTDDSFDLVQYSPKNPTAFIPTDPLNLVNDIWRLICNHLDQNELVNLAYSTKYFYGHISPICQLDALDMALQEYSVFPQMSKLRTIFSQRLVAQRLTHVAAITRRLQDIPKKATFISKAHSMVNDIMEPCRDDIQDLLLRGDHMHLSPRLSLLGGIKTRHFWKRFMGTRSLIPCPLLLHVHAVILLLSPSMSV